MKFLLNKMSLSQKVFAILVVNALGFVAVALVASQMIARVENQSNLNIRSLIPLNASIARMVGFIEQLEAETSGAPAEASNAALQMLREELARIGQVVLLIQETNAKRHLPEKILADGLMPLLREVRSIVAPASFTDGAMDPDSRASLPGLAERLTDFSDRLNAHGMEVGIKNRRVAIGYTVLTATMALIAVALFLWFVVLLNISRPLNALTDTINAFNALGKVTENELERNLIGRRDELGRMSRSFNRLKHNLYVQRQALQASKDEAEKANYAKSQFLAAASHDLRQPLHAMQLYIMSLRRKITDREALAVVEDIDAASISTARLLNALLDVSQLEAGVVSPTPEHFPVQEILRRVARSFGPSALQKNLRLRVVDSSAYVYADPVLLERIIGNFTSNAVRYTNQGSILIGCRHHGDKLSIEVLDTGSGIPEEAQHAIFDDFYQVHNKERDSGKGLGLGLAIARRLATQMGLSIHYASNVNRGSRFGVSVPVGEAVQSTIEIAQPELANVDRLQGTSVLLIEDNPTVLNATRQLFESWGCSVLAATTHEEAIAVLTKKESMVPEIIVADYRLPGELTGAEAAKHIQLMLGRAIPVIIVTGDVADDAMREVADQGYRVLAKPVRPAKLRALFSHLLN